MVKIIECPRDAMQGLKTFIPTETKAAYLNELLRVGFHTLDFGSFVSPKAIPQMRDTAEVLSQLDLSNTDTKLLAIVANRRGAESAIAFPEIDYLGYPFSISETFQLRNTNATIAESLERVQEIQELCVAHNKEMVIYISMGFGNPYGDPWNVEIAQRWVDELETMGITIFQLSDTIGVANPANIAYLFSSLIPAYPDLEIGAHFHTQPHNWEEKVKTAYENGCRRFDGAIKGFGGCPMAKDDLTGNMPTEKLLAFFEEAEVPTGVDRKLFLEAMQDAVEVFP
ncbi:hydroxymethylglutaryl-CoA lyase [Flavilitoribacter nigricans]|uniref:Hydroxymethylglutaryl-CoA lyase n=1 Tax=Flavilitoribacter nigricans (strain ATCC 23147 / DSM 23189 / NBRC 102662 / NCIMB 1420 / SS-2) TaxID=1122177 RepID=A0A2D0MY13_FLAN2|nr:hydroxymethylglutaryl-CoA lyase [Flavilitoribacter nigricans]PHN01107.1 hydroxymethylglutaryl-CoA lyase [Flavilitoribacter nigricans DSM 23189 = NBRC 102662]